MNQSESGHFHRVQTDAIGCRACRREFDMTRPLPKAGWQELHSCREAMIEVFVVAPGETPAAWRFVSRPQISGAVGLAGA